MKSLITQVALLLLIISGCSRTNKEPVIKYNEPAYIKLIAKNTIDSINVIVTYDPTFSQTSNQEKINIKRDSSYFLKFEMILPDFVELSIGNNNTFQTYLIPGDTLLINLHQGYEHDNKKSSTYYSIVNEIFNYCQAKFKEFGYYEIGGSPRRKEWFRFNLTRNEYSNYTKEVDSLKKLNLDFLNNYRGYLPDWFTNLEKDNIIYNAATCKLLFFQSFTNWVQRGDSLIDVQIYNPKGQLSLKYQEFLYHYFLHGHPNNEDLAGTRRITSLFHIELPRINSLLKGEIKDIFIIMNISKLYYWNRGTETELNLIDTLAATFTRDLSPDQMEYINEARLDMENSIRNKSLKTGDVAPGFILKDFNGINKKLSDFNGKIIYLHFWATWCSPCISEMPVLNNLIKEINNDDVVFINICLDNKYEKWQKIIEDNKLMGINLICNDSNRADIYKIYDIQSLPHYTLIDKNGKIVENNCDRPGSISQSILKLHD